MEVPLKKCLMVVVAAWSITCSLSQDVQVIKNCKPPSIRKQVEVEALFFLDNSQVELNCIAKGHGTLVYRWEKNGDTFDINGSDANSTIVMGPGSGTLHFKAQQADEGLYQCFVENTCGSSQSRKFSLSRARLVPFPRRDKPGETRAVLGSGVKLTCRPPESVPKAKVIWVLTDPERERNYDDQNDIESGFKSVTLDNRVTMDYDGNLYITSVRKEDDHGGMTYVCQAENTFTRSTNIGEDQKLSVHGMIPSNSGVQLQWNSGTETLVLEGRRARLKCIFYGYPEPIISWSRISGGDLNKTRMIVEGNELIINDAQFVDAGQYQCSGRNILSPESKSHTFTLQVEAAPQWKNKPRDIEAGVEESASFECEATGRPTPTVQWFINGVPYEDALPNPRRVLKDNVLSFTNLENSDSQVIQCNASNIHGYKWSDVYLYVEAAAPEIQKKPNIRTFVAEGQDLRISCQVYGKPKPKVNWYKGGQHLLGDRFEIMDNGDLLIKRAEMKDNGMYKCSAINKYGIAEEEGNVIVRERTHIINGPKSEQVDYTNPYTFTCRAATDPKEFDNLKYRWLRNGVEIKPSDRIIIKHGNLTITQTNSKDTAAYTCVADNGLDNDTAVATLQVKAVPDPPYNVSVEDCLGKMATIKWKFEEKMRNFDTMTKFIIEYTTKYKTDVWTEAKSQPYPASEAKVDLSPYAQYKFRVKAVNLMGISEPSDSTYSWCETPSAVPDRNPDNVHTDESSTGYLVVKWKPMDQIDLNGPNFHYLIEVQEQGSNTPQTFTVNDLKIGEKRIQVENIYRPYHVKVRAVNERGRAMSNPITVHGYSGEAPPLVVPENFELDPDVNVTSTSAGFRWDPVDTSPELIRGEFSGYKIRFWKAGQQDLSMHEHIVQAHPSSSQRGRRDSGDGKMRGVVANLPSYSDVEADIVVINKNFESNGSNIVNFSTPEGVPGRVEYLEALYRGSNHFLLQWGKPKEQNGIITGYQLTYRKIVKLDFERKVTAFSHLEPDVDRVTLKDLDPDSQYRIFIQAKTMKGFGREYFIDVKTISNSSSMALPVVKHVSPGENEANITWEVMPSDKGIRHGQLYYIEYKKKNDKDWKRIPNPIEGQLWGSLPSLESGTEYEVRVQAVTREGGDEFPSEVYNFRTLGFAASRASFLTAAWFIGMMVAICLLILILIIICIVKRNRGDNYPVQEKERLRGAYNDDNQDHFNGFGKGDENGVRGSNSFDHDAEKVPLDEDVDSLDYGDDDASKFNEDGSFIGQYGRGEKPNEGTNASSIV